MQIILTKSKICIVFLVLTLLYICARLRPIVSANVGLKSKFPAVTKDVQIFIGYEFDLSMLVHAILSSSVATIGISRWWSKKNKPQEQNTKRPNGSDAVRYNSLRKLLSTQNKFLKDNWHSLVILPWLFTFLISTIINYITLLLVLQYFCESYYQVFTVYIRLQSLFLKNVFNTATKHLSQLCGIFTEVSPYDDFIMVTMDTN